MSQDNGEVEKLGKELVEVALKYDGKINRAEVIGAFEIAKLVIYEEWKKN